MNAISNVNAKQMFNIMEKVCNLRVDVNPNVRKWMDKMKTPGTILTILSSIRMTFISIKASRGENEINIKYKIKIFKLGKFDKILFGAAVSTTFS